MYSMFDFKQDFKNEIKLRLLLFIYLFEIFSMFGAPKK